MTKSLKVGVIGCGMISDWYFKAAKRFKQLDIIACADLNQELAEKQGKEYDIPVWQAEDIYNSPEVQLIINLTPPKVHYYVMKRALESGKHAYSEKPLGVDLAQAKELLDIAKAKNLYVGCAPDTFMGGGHQTARKLLDDGWIGRVFAGTAMFMSRGPEKWKHAPAFYDVGAGPLLDIGPYFVTQLINLLGPAVAVTAVVTKGADFREGGEETVPHIYPVNVPTHQAGIIEFANGAQITLIGSYEVYKSSHPYIELYGTGGSLQMHHPNWFGGTVKVFQPGYEDWKEEAVPELCRCIISNEDLKDLVFVHSRANGDLELSYIYSKNPRGLAEILFSIAGDIEEKFPKAQVYFDAVTEEAQMLARNVFPKLNVVPVYEAEW